MLCFNPPPASSPRETSDISPAIVSMDVSIRPRRHRRGKQLDDYLLFRCSPGFNPPPAPSRRERRATGVTAADRQRFNPPPASSPRETFLSYSLEESEAMFQSAPGVIAEGNVVVFVAVGGHGQRISNLGTDQHFRQKGRAGGAAEHLAA